MSGENMKVIIVEDEFPAQQELTVDKYSQPDGDRRHL